MTSTDVSPAAVAAMLSYLRGACVGMGEEADFIQGLADERDQLAAKLAGAERERNEVRAISEREVFMTTADVKAVRDLALRRLELESYGADDDGIALAKLQAVATPQVILTLSNALLRVQNGDLGLMKLLETKTRNIEAANAEIARLRQQIAWFQAEAAKPPFRIEADFSPPHQRTPPMTETRVRDELTNLILEWRNNSIGAVIALNTLERVASFAIRNADAILAALQLADSHPSAIREAVEGEREACAKLVAAYGIEGMPFDVGSWTPGAIATAIRARGEEKGK